jgi:cell division protein FtsB
MSPPITAPPNLPQEIKDLSSDLENKIAPRARNYYGLVPQQLLRG